MKLSKKVNKIRRKKRAVSPIIAAILLIGLAVLAGAAVYLIVIPMLTSNTKPTDITIAWGGSGTLATSVNSTALEFVVTVTSKGTAAVTGVVTSVTLSISGQANQPSTGLIVKVGSADVTTTGIPLSTSTPQQTVDVTANFGIAYDAAQTLYKGGNIAITINFGPTGTVSQTFNAAIP